MGNKSSAKNCSEEQVAPSGQDLDFSCKLAIDRFEMVSQPEQGRQAATPLLQQVCTRQGFEQPEQATIPGSAGLAFPG